MSQAAAGGPGPSFPGLGFLAGTEPAGRKAVWAALAWDLVSTSDCVGGQGTQGWGQELRAQLA